MQPLQKPDRYVVKAVQEHGWLMWHVVDSTTAISLSHSINYDESIRRAKELNAKEQQHVSNE